MNFINSNGETHGEGKNLPSLITKYNIASNEAIELEPSESMLMTCRQSPSIMISGHCLLLGNFIGHKNGTCFAIHKIRTAQNFHRRPPYARACMVSCYNSDPKRICVWWKSRIFKFNFIYSIPLKN